MGVLEISFNTFGGSCRRFQIWDSFFASVTWRLAQVFSRVRMEPVHHCISHRVMRATIESIATNWIWQVFLCMLSQLCLRLCCFFFADIFLLNFFVVSSVLMSRVACSPMALKIARKNYFGRCVILRNWAAGRFIGWTLQLIENKVIKEEGVAKRVKFVLRYALSCFVRSRFGCFLTSRIVYGTSRKRSRTLYEKSTRGSSHMVLFSHLAGLKYPQAVSSTSSLK